MATSRHPIAGSRYEAGAGGLALWAEPTCDQIGFIKMRIAEPAGLGLAFLEKMVWLINIIDN
jgi:hypothetical protein